MKIVIVSALFFYLFMIQITTLFAQTINDLVKNGDLEKVKAVLIQNNELIDEKDDFSKTPLLYSIDYGNDHIAKFLIEKGADVNLADADGDTPLHYAGITGNVEIASRLLQANNLNIDKQDKNGMTPLHFACIKGNDKIISLLIKAGASLNIYDDNGTSPLAAVCASRNMKAVDILITNGADVNELVKHKKKACTILTLAAYYGFIEFIDYLISMDVAVSSESLKQTMEYAVQRDNLKLLEYSIGFDPDFNKHKELYEDLTYLAAESGAVSIMKFLIDHGFDSYKPDLFGWTPLHYSAFGGKIEMTNFLIEKGININAKSNKGETAYNIAAFHRLENVKDELKILGADTSDPVYPIISGDYMSQTVPGNIPELFMPGIVSGPYRAHGSITFNPEMDEAYWSDMISRSQVVFGMQRVNNIWTYPEVTIMWKDPAFSPDGSRLFFISREPLPNSKESGKENYWYMDSNDTGWTRPIPLSSVINSLNIHWQCSTDKDGNLYFSEFDQNMYCSEYKNGKYQKPVNLVKYFKNNTLQGCAPFISPDAEYLIFSDNGRLYVSYKDKEGNWTDRMDLGDRINCAGGNGSPRVSPDGKYLFFQSTNSECRKWGIYWVSFDIMYYIKR